MAKAGQEESRESDESKFSASRFTKTESGTHELEQRRFLRRIQGRASEGEKRGFAVSFGGERAKRRTEELALYSARIEFATLGVALFHCVHPAGYRNRESG